MRKLKRPMDEQDLKDKGLPFVCDNCGNKPELQQVIAHHGDCLICGDSIIVYSVDAAELILSLKQNGLEREA